MREKQCFARCAAATPRLWPTKCFLSTVVDIDTDKYHCGLSLLLLIAASMAKPQLLNGSHDMLRDRELQMIGVDDDDLSPNRA